jgi:hypothetical protein
VRHLHAGRRLRLVHHRRRPGHVRLRPERMRERARLQLDVERERLLRPRGCRRRDARSVATAAGRRREPPGGRGRDTDRQRAPGERRRRRERLIARARPRNFVSRVPLPSCEARFAEGDRGRLVSEANEGTGRSHLTRYDGARSRNECFGDSHLGGWCFSGGDGNTAGVRAVETA